MTNHTPDPTQTVAPRAIGHMIVGTMTDHGLHRVSCERINKLIGDPEIHPDVFRAAVIDHPRLTEATVKGDGAPVFAARLLPPEDVPETVYWRAFRLEVWKGIGWSCGVLICLILALLLFWVVS